MLAATASLAMAQGFGSVSSGKRMPDAAPSPDTAAETPADATATPPTESEPAASPAESSASAAMSPEVAPSVAPPQESAAVSTAPPPATEASDPPSPEPAPAQAAPSAQVASVDSTPPQAFSSQSSLPAAATRAPVNCDEANPFITGSAAVEFARACAATNPFLSGTGIATVAMNAPSGSFGSGAGPALATPAPTTEGRGAGSAPAVSGGTMPFGGSYEDAIASGPRSLETADRVLVKKSERMLYLMRADRVIAEYPVKLGLNPYGPKRKQGDFRTPEGDYRLVRRNSHSDFFLALEVSYPNEVDVERAREMGADPGGLIMIHGQPNAPRKPASYYASNDWTDGCIAVTNAAMVDIWLRTDVGTPIEIRP